MARTKKRRKVAARRNPARRAPRKTMRRGRIGNPGRLGSPATWIQGAGGVVAGVMASKAIPQMILGPSNTGAMGYAANAAATLGAGWLAAMLFPNKPAVIAGVLGGGFGALLVRLISDRTPYGSVLASSGLGDYGLGLYQKSNFNNPQRVQNGRIPSSGSSMFTWGDGSQRVSSMANAGSDSLSGAC